MSSLRDELETEARPITALGDIDAALDQVRAERRARRRVGLVVLAVAASVAVVALVAARPWTHGQGPSADPIGSASPSPTSPSPSPSGSAAERFTSTRFITPFGIDPPRGLSGRAIEPVETIRGVTWEMCVNDYCRTTAVLEPEAFVAPLGVSVPGVTAVDGLSPARDYTSYLRYLTALDSAHAAAASDWATVTVDGRPATEVTLRVSRSQPKSLGCESLAGTSGRCWGLEPGYPTRLAVIDTGAAPLLVLSTNSDVLGDPSWLDTFDQRLSTLRLGS